MSYVLAFLIATLGVAAFMYGGYDDSPGLQGIGLLLVLAAVALVVRAVRRARRHRA